MFWFRRAWFRRPVVVRPPLVPRPRFYRRRVGCFPLWGMLLLFVIATGAILIFILLRLG